MPDTMMTFKVGMALGATMEAMRHRPTYPSLAPGQRVFHVWSAPDQFGYRYLLTFAASPSSEADR